MSFFCPSFSWTPFGMSVILRDGILIFCTTHLAGTAFFGWYPVIYNLVSAVIGINWLILISLAVTGANSKLSKRSASALHATAVLYAPGLGRGANSACEFTDDEKNVHLARNWEEHPRPIVDFALPIFRPEMKIYAIERLFRFRNLFVPWHWFGEGDMVDEYIESLKRLVRCTPGPHAHVRIILAGHSLGAATVFLALAKIAKDKVLAEELFSKIKYALFLCGPYADIQSVIYHRLRTLFLPIHAADVISTFLWQWVFYTKERRHAHLPVRVAETMNPDSFPFPFVFVTSKVDHAVDHTGTEDVIWALKGRGFDMAENIRRLQLDKTPHDIIFAPEDERRRLVSFIEEMDNKY